MSAHGTYPVCTPLLSGNELAYVTEAVTSGWISSAGRYVGDFERAFAGYCGAAHGIAVCNGTAALHLALAALGIGPGHEVIVPSFTMIATAVAVCYTGAVPVFVDADPATWTIDPLQVAEKITERTKALIAVHIFGNPCRMDTLRSIAAAHGLALVEDAAEAHGAAFNGRRAGALSDIAAFSFFANKNLTTGEGGMVVTDNPALAERCRYLKNLCFPRSGVRSYLHEEIGFNYRMSNLHAAIGLAQTERADEYCRLRVRNGRLYRELLAKIEGIRVQEDQPGGSNVFWMNGLLVDPARFGRTRNELAQWLENRGIETRRFFVGMHRQPALLRVGCDGSGQFPVCDALSAGGLYLPSSSSLTPADIEYICEQIARFRCQAAGAGNAHDF